MASSSSTKWERAKNLFALIIGINNYQHLPQLSGAVADANAIDSFVRNDLGVPRSRIINLRDEAATRRDIIDAFRALQEDDGLNIERDDPILIYFAGHGCLTDPREEREGGDLVVPIQAICSQDVEVRDEPDRTIFPIPDYSLASLINRLSKKKGNNITVIFDCCHSASGTRELDDDEEGVRRVTFYGELPSSLDEDLIVGTRGQLIPLGFLDQHSHSHVLLAACGANEVAQETKGHGRFTKALLETLRKPGVDEISFIEFMKQMPNVKNQTPQCEGHFKDRILFSTQMQEMGLHFFPVVKRPNDEYYRIEAGSIHSVTKDSLFEVFEKAAQKSQFNKPLGTVRVDKVHSFHADAVLEPTGAAVMGNTAFALQVRRGPSTALAVHFASALLEVVRLCDVLDLLEGQVVHVAKEKADFVVHLQGTEAVFSTTLDMVKTHGYQGPLPNTSIVPAKPEPIARVLLAACRWKLHLYACPSQSYWRDEVHIEFFNLGHVEDGEYGDSLQRKNASKLNDGNKVVVEVTTSDDRIYGLEIQNHTKKQKELYLSLFMFQIGDLSIDMLYSGPIGTHLDGGADPSLVPNSSLQIGCGDGGGLPFQYDLPKGIDVDVAILKVYLTTKPTSFEWLRQDSPFLPKPDRHPITGDELKKRFRSSDLWDTVLFTVVQRVEPH